MDGLQHVPRARRISTKFTLRVSWARTICDRSKKRPRPLFRKRSLAAPKRPRTTSHEKELLMSTPADVDRPIDTAISDALTDLALDLRWSFNQLSGSALGATRP